MQKPYPPVKMAGNQSFGSRREVYGGPGWPLRWYGHIVGARLVRGLLQAYDYARAKLVLAGLSESQMYAQLRAIVAKNGLPTPEPGSMSYMMSKHQYLNDGVGNWYPHLMFHVPQAQAAHAGAEWGANLPGSPVVMDSAYKLWPEPQTIFFVPLAKWSDGTPGPRL